jgi:glycosyltransferase involved in cell wall biosynthesis
MDFDGLRIALVGPRPPPAGGMARLTALLEERLRAEGASVECVPTNPSWRGGWLGRVRGVRAAVRLLYYIGPLWQAIGRADLVHLMANSGWSWHLHAVPAIWIGWLRRRPVVVNYHGGNAAPFLQRASGMVRFSMRRTAALVVPSGFLQQVFADFGMAAAVLPNPVDLDLFREAVRPDRRPGPHLVVTRNLEPIYDVDTALHTLRRLLPGLPDAWLSIAGDGDQRARLGQLADELGLAERVRFTGQLAREEIALLYASADVMLNTSRVDNLPGSVLEALASGVPVVTTDVGGIPYLVRNGETALLVPPGDPDAMAAAVRKVVLDPVLAGILRERGLQLVQQYAWPAVRARLRTCYTDVLRCTDTGGEPR